MKKIAIYDVDYTIISVNSHLSFTFFLLKKKPFNILRLFHLSFYFVLWIFHFISTEKVKSKWLILIRDIQSGELEKLSSEFVEKELIKKIKPGALNSINKQRKNGFAIIFASASYEFYIKYLAEYFNADHCFGTRITDNGKGKNPMLDGKNCKGKEKIVRILHELDINEIDTAASCGYSDSITDIHFLDLSGTLYLVKRKSWEFFKVLKK